MPKKTATKPPKPTRAEKKAKRKARGQSRRDTWRNLAQAFTMTRKNDSRMLPLVIGTFVLTALVVYALAALISGHVFLFIPVAIAVGLIAAMFLFSRRAQHAAYSQADGQPGAALYVLQNLRGADWKTTEAVAATAQLDAVHRLTGRPGIVLVGEGSPTRVKNLIAQEKRRLSRLVGDVPIYDVVVGADEDQVKLAKLNNHLIKLPRNLSSAEVTALNRKLAAIGGGRAALPQGPLPAEPRCATFNAPSAGAPAEQEPARTRHPGPAWTSLPVTELNLPLEGAGSAGPLSRRIAAYLLDAVASSFVAALFVHNGDLPGLAGRLPGAWSVIPFVVNYVGGLVLGGQTLGMHLLGLRVVRTDRDLPIGIGRALIRTGLLILLIPAVIFDRNNRGLHDRVTDTVVVRT